MKSYDSYCHVPDLGDEWKDECVPILRSHYVDTDKLKKKYASFIDKFDRSKENADLAYRLQRKGMYFYWNAVKEHYYEQLKLLGKALTDIGVNVSEIK